MQDKFKALIDKINHLTLRERVLVLLACLVVLYQLWDSLLWVPLNDKQDDLMSREAQINQQMVQLQVDLKVLTAGAALDPDRETKKQIQNLKSQLSVVNEQIKQTSSSLVSPAEMAKLLEQLLISEKGLGLVSLKTQDSVALIPMDAKQLSSNNYQIYRHGFSIEFEGSYFATLRYIEALEKLPWKFFWEGIEYQVERYPGSRVRLNLYTLSLSKGWIGV